MIKWEMRFMKCGKSMIIVVLAVFIFGAASVCASDVATVGDVDSAVELTQADADEMVSADENELVSEGNAGTFSELQSSINTMSGSTLTLNKSYINNDDFSSEGITIDRPLTIDGQGNKIDAQEKSRIFKITSDNVILKNIIFTNGKITGESPTRDGGAVFFEKSGTVINCNFVDNKVTVKDRYGGAVFFSDYGDYYGEVINCNFTGNSATYSGGAVWMEHGSVENCNFDGNSATWWGGAILMTSGNVNNCNFDGNSATWGGGAIEMFSGSVENCNFGGNSATDGSGGAIYILSGSVENCNFTGNSAAYDGGAIRMYYGSVENCNFTGNSATYSGGAVWMEHGSVENCYFDGNSATDGGAIIMSSGNVTNCNFDGNSAADEGGAIYMSSGNVENCNFGGNSASDGGAIFMESGTVSICKFTNNSANHGGAIYCKYNVQTGQYNFTVDTCIIKTESDTIYPTRYLPPTMNVDNFTTIYNSNEKLTFDLRTNSSIPVTNGNISITVYFKDNNTWVCNYSCLSGEGWIPNLRVGSYYAIFDTEYLGFQPVIRTITVNKAQTQFVGNAITVTYNANKNLVITLKDAKGNPLSGVSVTVVLKGAKTCKTDKNGQIKVSTKGLVPKKYTVKVTFNGDTNYYNSTKDINVTVKKATPKVTPKKKTFKSSVKTKKYTITLKDNTGKAIKKAKVTLKVKGKTYKATTNSKGKAVFKIKKLNKKGTYKATITYKGNKYYNKVSKKAKIKVIVTFKTVSRGSKDKSTVKEIQQALKDNGYYLSYKGHYLKVDGKFSSCTFRSIKEFQKDKGLKVTGKVDEKTAKKLGII